MLYDELRAHDCIDPNGTEPSARNKQLNYDIHGKIQEKHDGCIG